MGRPARGGAMTRDTRVPGLLKINGSIGSTLIVGTEYRVAEIREHHEPSGIEGEPPEITTVIRFDPVSTVPSLEGARHPEPGEPFGEADNMCPNCVTPWKCNGPHLF